MPLLRRGELVPFDPEPDRTLQSACRALQFGTEAAGVEPTCRKGGRQIANSTNREAIVRAVSTITNDGANNG